MATKTLCVKEHEGLAHNPIGQLPSVTWWGAIGPQAGCGDMYGQLKHLAVGQTTGGFTTAKQVGGAMGQGLEKVNSTQFTIFPGDCKASNDGTKHPQSALSLQTVLPEYGGPCDLGLGQPVLQICAKFPSMDQHYGLFSTYGPQISGRIMLPMSLTTDDGPIFVNPKQYHGIIRRRKSRAKAVLENKVTGNRKPYMHYSRHLHAMRRPRGSGGRFLNSKNADTGQDGIGVKRAGDVQLFQQTGSQSSEVLQSDSGTMNSSKDANDGASNISGSEVTSMYSRGDLEQFKFNHPLPPVHHFSGMMSSRHGIVTKTPLFLPFFSSFSLVLIRQKKKMATTTSSQSRRSGSGPVLRSLSPGGRFYNSPTSSYMTSASSSSSSAFASSTSSSFLSPPSSFFPQSQHHSHHRSASPTRVNLYASAPLSPSFRFSIGRSISPNRSAMTVTKQSNRMSLPKKTCMCSPTTHPGSFRCSLHKNLPQSHGNGAASYTPHRLNMRRSAMKNSLVRIGGVEGEWVKRALTALIRPSSHQQRRRGDFQPRPSRLSIMSKAGDDDL